MTDLRQQIIELGPWHLEVEVDGGISTEVFLDAPPRTYSGSFGPISFNRPRPDFHTLMSRLYPDGLASRSVLDCACNCGGYLFWAKELGAGECMGFDVRSHWIDQARFLTRHRSESSEDIRFEVCDLYDLGRFDLAPFDITLFQGILYHLPDPVTGLKIAAELTRELLIVNTATRNGLPDRLLFLAEEDPDLLMSGSHGLNWFPTGPEVLRRILAWLGFGETRLLYWRTEVDSQPAELGRLSLLAARTAETFLVFDSTSGGGTGQPAWPPDTQIDGAT